MAKSIIKEIIIALLLCLAIILVLGILLYEYTPMTKTIPNEVAYKTPEDVKEELLSSSDVDDSQIVMTYEITASDLKNYTRVQNYKPGKANPFSSYETTEGNGSSTGGTNTSNNNSSSSTNTSTEDDDTSDSGGHFFQNTGTK